MRVRKAFVACLALLAVLSVPLAAQSADGSDNFGTTDGIDLWIPASSFTGNAGWLEGPSFGYFYATTGSSFHAVVPLPQGALLDSWRAFFYDSSASNEFTIGLVKWLDDSTNSPTQANQTFGVFTSNGTPGFTNHHEVEGLTIDLREPSSGSVTRAEAADFYSFYVVMPTDFNVAFKGVRVIWHRQVSPAPAVATFNDVPTSDPTFQYIEALAASGITAGCNAAPPMYCPDATLTRRQMAVFLSKALGLHWPNR
ncbi:MAG TPA: S-layer homology domain-containing protein [Thermoanaerobaculia bacterium]|jgi:hypothetical protein|nr:S-layer homology domain-containing protein [Thermoanaerobaculia bacterium]